MAVTTIRDTYDGNDRIPFNRPYLTGRELSYIAEAHLRGQLAGDGQFTKRCQRWLEDLGGSAKALLTHSCTAALEMAAILCDIQPGDEVIMPSYTFVSTANAFVLRGAVPVFVDIRIDTLNMDETKIEAAITPRTKAIVPVHYAGVACEMDTILDIARRHSLYVIEDAAQGCMSTYKGRYLGTIGDFGCLSFHETKNIISGEGGALLINRREMVERAEIIREKGTNRSKFIRGEVDKYTWTDVGSSFLPGELVAAFLWAQMEEAQWITEQRLAIWSTYDERLSTTRPLVATPTIPYNCTHNAHMYYVINQTPRSRDDIITNLGAKGINSVFHYVPLHSAPFGRRFGKPVAHLPVTDYVSSNLIRMPLWLGMSQEKQMRIIDAVLSEIGTPSPQRPVLPVLTELH
jgi:dTDP-4-amino-4,6-dideoxygalactose transaminase